MRLNLKSWALLVLGLAGTQTSALETPGYPWVEVSTDAQLFENNSTAFSVTQTGDGTFIVGISDGLFTFDGRRWAPLEVPGVRNVMGLGTDLDGRILVGTYEQFGYLELQENGQLKFVSIRQLLPKEFAERRLFFSPMAADDGVYFTSLHTVFRWDRGQRVEAFTTTDFFPYLIKVGGNILISDGAQGLSRINGAGLENIEGAEETSLPGLPQAKKITAAMPFREGWLMATEKDGFRFYDGQRVEPIELPGSDALRESPGRIVRLESLNDGHFVAADDRYNLILFDSTGTVSARWEPNALPGYITSGLFVDANKEIWVTVNNGMLRLDLDKSIRVLDSRAQCTLPKIFFANGDRRFFSLEEGTVEWVQGEHGGSGSVRPIEGVADIVGVFDGDMMYHPTAGSDLMCRYADGRIQRLMSNANWDLRASPHDSNVVYALKPPHTVAVLKKRAGEWRIEGDPVSVPVQFEDLVEGPSHFWLILGEGRIARGQREPLLSDVTVFDQKHGLPDSWIHAFLLGGEILFGTRDGICNFDETTSEFRADPRFAQIPEKISKEFRSVATDAEGNIWVGSTNGSGILRRQSDGSFSWDVGSLSVLGTLRIQKMFWDEAGWMWCKTTKGFLAIRPEIGSRHSGAFSVRLGEVRDLSADRTLIGAFRAKGAAPPELNYAQNALQFDVVAPDFRAPGALRFQFKLEGSDANWSAWVNSPIRRYPALHEGQYVFHFRAENAYGKIADGIPFEFTVMPPVYRTLPAYFLYAALLGGGIWSGFGLYSRRFHQQNARLEKIIGERTHDLDKAHRELVDASHLAGMAEVATNVLHNVGNVLNSVNVSAALIAENVRRTETNALSKLSALFSEHEDHIGDFLSTDPKGKLVPKFLQLAANNAGEERAQVLTEIASLQENVDHIKNIVAMQQAHATAAAPIESLDPETLMEDALRLSRSHLAREDVEIERRFQRVPLIIGQRQKVLQILVNLMRNAADACGKSGVTGRLATLRLESGASGQVRFIIEDNGVGIAPEKIMRIFNQGFGSRKDAHGYGLHTAANAAAEMKGSLTVRSDGPGMGATFTLELPAAP